ncbi:RluA family pseudouridine synthase [Candidatus Uhrbacteria bacterium]|nr:RluA family pseudouridine synthase [Candidatus Uhrbacteria bacterium]
MKITITASQAGARIDQIVQQKLSDLSRSQIQKQFFDQDRVMVSGKVCTKHYRVKKGDVITVATETGSGTDLLRETEPNPVSPPTILHETDQYVILDKPSGLLTHPTQDNTEPSVAEFLLSRYPSIRKVGDDPTRPGIVHRLDKDASGIMVAAKTQQAFDSLKRQFKLRHVEKEYLVLVYGSLPREEGDIAFSLKRAKHSPRIAATSGSGRAASTHYVVEERFSRYSLARVMPRTGRTHQIRVHFFAYGHPIVGDAVYAPKHIKKVEATRLMLHAFRLGFHDINGEWREHACPPGSDFENVVRRLRT